jgi:hypothetical protein
VTYLALALGALILAGIVIDVHLEILRRKSARMVREIEQRERDTEVLNRYAREFYAEANRRWSKLVIQERRVH